MYMEYKVRTANINVITGGIFVLLVIGSALNYLRLEVDEYNEISTRLVQEPVENFHKVR